MMNDGKGDKTFSQKYDCTRFLVIPMSKGVGWQSVTSAFPDL